MIDHSHRGFDVIREQEFVIIKGENFVFENNTVNEGTLNAKQTEKVKRKNTQWYFWNIVILLGAQAICLVHKAIAFSFGSSIKISLG